MNRYILLTALVVLIPVTCIAQDKETASEAAAELEVLKASIGVWDASIEVWSNGLDAPPIKFTGVETNRPYGAHWIVSDFDSQVMGQTMKIHSIIGYDVDKKKLVGTQVDHGPHAAKLTGEYDKESKQLKWVVHAKDLSGNEMVQRTTITQVDDDTRVLVLNTPGQKEGEFAKFMEIKFVKRKTENKDSK